MSAFDAYVQAKYHGGTIPGGPTFTVIHDAETPLASGYCDSIVEFFRAGPAAQTSAHAMTDPSKAVKMLPDDVVAYAAGPYANTFGWHMEQAGYARFTRADWTTADGQAQLHRVAACIREVHDQWGIPKRWVTDDQLRAAAKGDRSQGGMTTHQQVARVLGGTTHTDPEDNYPRDLLLAVVLGGTETGDDMYGPDQRFEVVSALTEITGNTRATNGAVAQMAVQQAQILAAVTKEPLDVAALAAKILPVLVPAVVDAVGAKAGLTEADVEAAIRKVLGGLDTAA